MYRNQLSQQFTFLNTYCPRTFGFIIKGPWYPNRADILCTKVMIKWYFDMLQINCACRSLVQTVNSVCIYFIGLFRWNAHSL